MPAVGPKKIGTIADLALNPILLLDEADGGGLEDPHGLRDGRRVLDGHRVLVATVLVHARQNGFAGIATRFTSPANQL